MSGEELYTKVMVLLRGESCVENVPPGFVSAVMGQIRELRPQDKEVVQVNRVLSTVQWVAVGICAATVLVFIGLKTLTIEGLEIEFEYALQAGIDPWMQLIQIQ